MRPTVDNRRLTQSILAFITFAFLATIASAQVSEETLESNTIPDQVETSIGALKLRSVCQSPANAHCRHRV